MNAGRVVVYVGDDDHRVTVLGAAGDWDVEQVDTIAAARERLPTADCLVVEGALPDGTGIELCRSIREEDPHLALVLVPETGSDELARAAVAVDVDEYVPAGTIDDPGELREAVARALGGDAATPERYRTLVEQSTDVITVVDPDGTIEYVSPAIEAQLGYAPADLVGEDALTYVHPEDRTELRGALTGGLEHPEGAVSRECRVEHADGGVRWVEIRARNRLEDPAIGGIVVSVRDVTDRREREREQELYETMLNAVPDMVYAIDDDGQFLAINETFEAETGLDGDEIMGSHVSIGMDEDDVRQGRHLVRELLHDEGREKGIYELEFRTASGDPIPVENHIGLLTTDDGELRGSVGVLRDISDRKRRERRLTVLNRALRHDLRNSMHVILANAELVERAIGDEAAIDKLRTIQQRAQAITSLSDKAREIEHTIGGRTLPRERIDVARLLTAQSARFRDRYPDATVDVDVPDHAWVEAVELVDVAVENLIENSLEHTDDQYVEVRVDVAPDTVTVTVADDGPGIPAKERRLVSQGSETPLDHASGLGLWLVAWITRDSGGRIVFEDETDGSVVKLVLDRAPPDPDQAE